MKNKRKKRTALITGITGQDGSYLAEFLFDKGYLVYGLCRRVSYFNRNRIEHLRNKKNFKLVYGDLSDLSSLMNIIKMSNPDEIYNLAAQSHVYVSFNVPEYTTNVNSLWLLRILDCVKNIALKTQLKVQGQVMQSITISILQTNLYLTSQKDKIVHAIEKRPKLVQNF